VNRNFWLYTALTIFAVNLFVFIYFMVSAPTVDFSFDETNSNIDDVGNISLLGEEKKPEPETVKSLEEKQAKLLKELEAGGEEKLKKASAPEVVAVKCYEIGPLYREADVKELEAGLKGLDLKTARREQGPQQLLGYWVYLAPERSMAMARLKLEELKSKGLTDLAIVVKQTPRYAISLGLFHHKNVAEDRIKEVSALGYKPLITLRYKDKKQTWLKVEVSDKREIKESRWNEMLKKYEGAKIRSISCD